MDQLGVLREIQRRIGGDEFVKLEIGNYEGYDPTVSTGEARLVVIKNGTFFPALVTDDEWENPEPLITQVVGWVQDILVECA
jgi:hypothetical protein